jgi:hypothetical protein
MSRAPHGPRAQERQQIRAFVAEGTGPVARSPPARCRHHLTTDRGDTTMAGTPRKQSRVRTLATLLAILTLMPLLTIGLTPTATEASSHREAPLIAEDPLADATDVYAFTSPDNTDTVTLVANYVPFQQPAGGPNFYRFGDDVRYQILVDNNADAKPDIIFTWTFKTTTVNPNTFLYNVGEISYNAGTKTYTNWNRPQTYTLTMQKVTGFYVPDYDSGAVTVLGSNLLTPPVNIGPRSTPNYPALASNAVHLLPQGIKSFAGQRDDPFYADLGKIFDLLGVVLDGGEDYVAGLSVNSLVLQVPKSLLKGPNDDVIGVWTSASRKQLTVLDGNGGQQSSGRWIQVSRLGNPLVNEVVIPLGQKNRFNATRVAPNSDNPFATYVVNSEVAGLLRALGIDPDAPTMNRQDLVTVFLTGVPGINKPAGTISPVEVLRLNMATPVSATPLRMGVLAGQLDGFPNGRRLVDDVVDIEVQAVAGILCQTGGPLAGGTPCRTTMVNTDLGDGVDANDLPFKTSFPYLADPQAP